MIKLDHVITIYRKYKKLNITIKEWEDENLKAKTLQREIKNIICSNKSKHISKI